VTLPPTSGAPDTNRTHVPFHDASGGSTWTSNPELEGRRPRAAGAAAGGEAASGSAALLELTALPAAAGGSARATTAEKTPQQKAPQRTPALLAAEAQRAERRGIALMKCFCFEGFAGEDCGLRSCSDDCRAPQAYCDEATGVCYCERGYAGIECSAPVLSTGCRTDCGPHGSCDEAKRVCACEDGWSGDGCENKVCSSKCSSAAAGDPKGGHGTCVDDRCRCEDGWKGDDCDEPACPDDCRAAEGRGTCHRGTCFCADGFHGPGCGARLGRCPNACSGNGECRAKPAAAGQAAVEHECVCKAGFRGSDCSVRQCKGLVSRADGTPAQCSDHGVCDAEDATCLCDRGWSGDDCSCERECLNGGECVGGACACPDGYRGDACERTTCADDCLGRGECKAGRCACRRGYQGERCEDLVCPNFCSDNGFCNNGVCLCRPGWIGEDCSVAYDASGPRALSRVGSVLRADYRRLIKTQSSLRTWLSPHKDASTLLLETYVRELKGEFRQLVRRMKDDLRLIGQTAEDAPPGAHVGADPARLKTACKTVMTELSRARWTQPTVGGGQRLTRSPTTGEAKIQHVPGEPIDVGAGEWRHIEPARSAKVRGGFFQREPADVFTLDATAHAKLTGAVNAVLTLCDVQTITECPNDCSGRGECSRPSDPAGVARCSCKAGWGGVDCQRQNCVQGCNGHGSCSAGVCECEEGWGGVSCKRVREKKCTKNCMARCAFSCSEGGPDKRENDPDCYWACYDDCLGGQECHLREARPGPFEVDGAAVSARAPSRF
jgi:hypothetical protein